MDVLTKETLPPLGEGKVKPRILVADDNVGLAEIWSFVLQDAGYDVTVVGSGGDSLAALARETYNVAVLDLQMPDLSGLDVFTALQADTPDVEGIIITGHASMESAIEAVNRGVFSYLVKPVTADVLRVFVGRALERQRLQSENRVMLSQLSALQDVLDAALESVGLEDALQRMIHAVVTAMRVDAAALLLGQEDGLLPIAVYPPISAGAAGKVSPTAGVAGRIFTEHKAMRIDDLRLEPMEYDSHLPPMAHSLLGVPVLSGDRAIGVLQVVTMGARQFDDRDLRLLEAIAQRMALAVEKSRLMEEREEQRRALEAAYRRERRIAETLQRSFLPDLRLSVPGVAVAHLYQAALDEAEVGGDFYDIVDFGEGLVGLVMGDVSGKGLDAAVYTALTKYTLRSYALEDPDPGKVMARLNLAFVRQSTAEAFATLFYGLLDVRRGRLTYVSAGHEPALLHRPSQGITEWLRSTGPIAGVFPDADFETAETAFEEDDLLLLYTDGASDARRNDQWLGTQGLQALLEGRLQPQLQDTLAEIYQGILTFARNRLRDDTALLLVSRRPNGS